MRRKVLHWNSVKLYEKPIKYDNVVRNWFAPEAFTLLLILLKAE